MRRICRSGFLTGVALALAAGITLNLVGPNKPFVAAAFAEASQLPIGYADLVDKVKPATISVRVKVPSSALTLDDNLSLSGESLLDQLLRRFSQPDDAHRSRPPRSRNLMTRQGSGFFISADGYAVTNGHVVENVKTAGITIDSGTKYTANIIGIDRRTDIALIKVDGDDFPFVKFAEASPRVGDLVLAIGNPFGLGGTVTAGIVSGRGRDIGQGPYDDFIQIDASVNNGNSGGPTFDMDGNVVGVNTAIVTPTGGSVGLAFAVPAEIVKNVVAQLREKGAVSRGWIGVQTQDITPEIADSFALKQSRGALVADPQANGPAAKSGIEAGDVITTVNGKEIDSSRELALGISGMSPGTPAKLTILRKGQDKTIELMIGMLPDQGETKGGLAEVPRQRGTNIPQLGLSVVPRQDGSGVVVSNVVADGVAAEYDIQAGDVIIEAAGKKVSAATDVRNAAGAALKGKRPLLLRIKSGDLTKFVALPVTGRG